MSRAESGAGAGAVAPMPVEVADGEERVDLVAAALCDAGFFPEAWDFTEHTERAAYRRETRELLSRLDARAAARYAGLVAERGGDER